MSSRRQSVIAAVLISALAASAVPARGALIRVGPQGDVVSALKRARAGDVVELMTGRYVIGHTVVSHGGRKDAPITVRAGAGQKPVIACGSATNAAHNQTVYFYTNRPKEVGWWVLEGIEITGGYTYCMKVDMSHMVFRRCKFHDSGRDCIKTVTGADDILFDGCEIYNSGRRDPSNAEGIDMMGGDGLVVRNCHIHDTPTCGVYAKGAAKNVLYEGNLVERTGHQALGLGQSSGLKYLRGNKYECYNGVARNNVIAECRGGGIMLSSALNSKVCNNTLYEPATKSGGALYLVNCAPTRAANKDFEIRNNVVYSSSQRWFVVFGKSATDPAGKNIIDNNLYFHPAGKGQVRVMCEDARFAASFYGAFSQYQKWGFGKASIIADPGFVDAAKKNFRLRPGSPAIDRGFTIDDLKADRDGKARPVGRAIDLGAYEFGESAAATKPAESKPAATVITVKRPPNEPPPSDAKAAKLYRSARAAERAGMKALARTLYERLVKEFPDDPLAEKARAKLEK